MQINLFEYLPYVSLSFEFIKFMRMTLLYYIPVTRKKYQIYKVALTMKSLNPYCNL